MRILPTYILRLHLVPFILGFGVVTFILEMDVLFDYLDLVVNRGVSPAVVLQLFGLSLGYIVALSVPCAVLVAVLMTFGRLSQDNEIIAMRAGGVNLLKVLAWPLTAAGLVVYGLILFNNYVLPETNHAFANLLIDIGRMRPTVKLQEGVFINDFPGYNLLVQSVNSRTNEMRGVTLYELNPGGPPTTILAHRGYLSYSADGQTAILELHDGEIHEIPYTEGGTRKYRRLQFKTHVINVPGAGGLLERTVRTTRSDREMSARALMEERARVEQQYGLAVERRAERLRDLDAPPEVLAGLAPDRASGGARIAALLGALLSRETPVQTWAREHPEAAIEFETWRAERKALQRRIATLSVEIHKKFSLPTACLVFALIGAPLGMRVRRAGPGVAFVSVAFFLFYYLCLVGGEELASRLLMPPWFSMWLPNMVLGAWGVVWTLRACELRRAPPGVARRLAEST